MKKKVLFIHSIAGSTPNPANPKRPTEFAYKPGQTVSLDADLADAWIASGLCEPAPDDPDALKAQIALLTQQLAEAEKKSPKK